MGKGIRIELTEEQIDQLRSIMDKIRKWSDEGNPGMAVAQIYYDHIACGCLPHSDAKKVQELLGRDTGIITRNWVDRSD